MTAFNNIRRALVYIDEHLEDNLTIEQVAGAFHFSPYYFHRMFTAIAGDSLAAYIRKRRIGSACRLISATEDALTEIGLACGFRSQQAFIRAFKEAMGVAPGEYRRQKLTPDLESVDDIIRRFTNRLKGGMIVNPRMIKRDALYIAGVTGPGSETAALWQRIEDIDRADPIPRKISNGGYEIRLYAQDTDACHVGYAVASPDVREGLVVIELPAGEYASFDVYVSQGYDSENTAMNDFVNNNDKGYAERLLGGRHFVVEYYDERFNGEADDSIVEIWVPVEKG